ncbi:Hrp-dependent type III effector family protein [Erwinia tracheiphila PSU-1]|nr:Hrp-dependent type III effector family protein [Erwinia tracheiphila PSU-1]
MQWKTSVLVVVDDFTGANDAGCGLAAMGARVNVLFNPAASVRAQDADVWILNTDSRACDAALAAQRTLQAYSPPGGAGRRWLDFQKGRLHFAW